MNANGWIDKSQPQAQQLIAIRPQAPAYEPTVFPNVVFAPNNARAADWTDVILDPALGTVSPITGAVAPGTAKLNDFDPYSDNTFLQLALREDIELTDALTLTSLTTYDRYTQDQRVDADGSEYLIQNLAADTGDIHSLMQELRLANSSTSRYRFTLGGNYEDSDTLEYQLNRYLHTAYNPSMLYINASGITNDQKIRNYAFFDSSEYSLTDRVTLNAAARYTSTSDSANVCSTTIPGGNVDTLFNVLGSALGKVPFTPIGPSNCYTLNANYVPGQPFVSTLKQDNVSWRGGIDYQLTPTLLLYADASRGFKAGSFPSLAASIYAGLQPVTQESVTAYEGGIKTQLFDRRANVDAAAFYYDYKDKQVRGKLADPIFGDLDALINIPKSRIYGAEAAITVRPVSDLTLTGTVTYLSSKIIQYTGVNIVGQSDFNSAGDPLPFTPAWTGAFNADYRVKTHLGSPFAGITVAATSSSQAAISATRIDYSDVPNSFVRPGVECVFCIAGYATVDARLGYEADGGRWNVSLWGKNILNRYYWTTVIPVYDSAARSAGMPSTFGISFGVKTF
jgi:iron complex outermembrane receptor protein